MNTLNFFVLKIRIILIVLIFCLNYYDSSAQHFNNLNIDSGSSLNSSLNQYSSNLHHYTVLKIDTSDYSIFLNLFRKRRDLFIENKTYFFVNNESLSNQLSLDDFDIFFNKFQTEPLKKFIQQHSSNVSHSLSDFINSSNTSMQINLATGSEVVIKKDFGSLMITDNKNFESIINGHMFLNNCSIFFIQILLK